MLTYHKHFLLRLSSTPYFDVFEQELSRTEAGLAGENYFEQCFHTSTLIKLRNIVLEQEQIDFILLHNTFIMICEVKNWKGQLHFSTDPPQVIQDGTRILTSPELQLPLKIRALHRQIGHSIPILGCIILAYNNVTFTQKPVAFPMIFARQINAFLDALITKFQAGPTYNAAALALKITAASRPWHMYPLMQYAKIPRHAIANGVRCTTCNALRMQKRKRTWYCPTCQQSDPHADLTALKEYYHFIADKLTYKEAMQFLGVDDFSTIRRIFAKAGLRATTEKKDRETYFTFTGSTLLEDN